MTDKVQSSRIETASAWVLRVGVILSALVMITGIAVSHFHGNITIEHMQSTGFDMNLRNIATGIAQGRGMDIIEAGVLLLALTPVMRVAASMILFAVTERDWLYAGITLVVLILTLTGLIFA